MNPAGDVDLVLRGGLCVTCDEAGTVTAGDVYVDGGRIVAVGGPARGARRSVDASGTIVLPGLVNLHDHLRDMTPGLDAGEGLKLDEMLRFYWRLNEAAGAVEYETMAAYSTARLLASGVTTVVDHVYPFHRHGLDAATIAGYEATGIRWYLARGLMTRGYDPISEPLAEGFERVRSLLADGTPAERIMLAPVSFRQAAPTDYAAAREFASTYGLRLYTHVAETAAEVHNIEAEHGCRPIEFLDRLGFCGPDVTLVHCVELLASTGSHVVHCPSNHMKLAKGFTRVLDLLDAGVNVGLGIDQMADMFCEMRQEVLLQAIRNEDPGAVSPAVALRMATANGAKAVGLGGQLGEISVGALADLICVSARGLSIEPILDPAWSVVHRAGGSDVRHVIVDGRVVMEDREFAKLDAEALHRQAMDVIDGYFSKANIARTRIEL
ncbi:MAG: amidohydrolase family protein [Acidimicrobiia bacterium]|nr:amidohydrolase family protein [Acidimicrobiia bacterium]